MNQAPKRWLLRPGRPEEALRFAEELGISPITAQVLLNRNIASPEQARAFLQPSLNDLHDPWALPDAEKAALRVHQAVAKSERIVVYGDYDADGITATALLVKCLRLLGAHVDYYVPDRLEEGYGLNAPAVRRIAAEGAKLIITADCGMTAVEEVELARASGVDVIVTDHHEAGPHWPRLRETAHSVVSALREDSTYPFQGLSGVGVAFKLAWAIGKTLSSGQRCSEEFQNFLLDAVALVALGTIADVVPLLGENRVLARYGLGGLSDSQTPGLRELRRCASVDGKELSAFDVAFKLAPRLNVAGRLGTARRVVELLTTESEETAREIASFLTAENTRRQKIQEQILTRALEMLAAGPPVEELNALVLASEGWHPGVVGVVAAKLVEQFYRPAVVLSIEAEEVRGSARSVEGLHLFEALVECDSVLTRYGGHALAAGLRLRREHLESFREMFCQAVARRLAPENRVPILRIDAEVSLSALTPALLRELERLGPYGQGNPEPIFASFSLQVAGNVQRMGTKGAHLAFWVRQGDSAMRAVAFRRGELADELQASGVCALAYRPRIDDYGGIRQVELRLEDIRCYSAPPPEAGLRSTS